MKKKKINKKVGVLFSSGLDSTFLLYKNLMEGNTVQPFYVEISNNTNKTIIEKQKVVELYTQFRKEFGELIEEPSIIVKSEIWINYNSGIRFKQLPIWLLGIQYIGIYDEIQIGYVSNDDAVPYLDEIHKLYKSMDFMFTSDYKRPKLTFPIVKYKKEDIADELPSKYFDLVYSCENPMLLDQMTEYVKPDNIYMSYSLTASFLTNGSMIQKFKPCGECDPCKKIMHNDYLFNKYIGNNKEFFKLKIKDTISSYRKFEKDTKYNNEIKEVFDEIKKMDELTCASYEMDKEIEKENIKIS